MSLFAEIKRRKVFRVAVVYAATAFAILQAADVMLPRLGVPEWAMSLIVLLVVLGFPVALVLAWALELTPQGVRVTAPAEAGATQSSPPLLGGRTVMLTLLLLVLGIGVGAGWFLRPAAAPDGERGDASAEKSIAVLPFADFSPGGGQQWFSDGLAEEILNALARLPDLRVASRTGSFQFRGHAGDVRAIADSLGVAHLLEGSVQRTDTRVRITAQLIRAADNRHLWSQKFDRDAADVIRVQEEIAYEIARTLQTALQPEKLAEMVATGTNSVAAYEAFLRYWHLMHQAVEAEDWQLTVQAHDAIEEARRLDPQFHRAHNEAAEYWLTQLTPTTRWYGLSDLSYAEREARARERLHAAGATAPDELSRLRAERNRARLDLRLRDVLEMSQRIVELDPSGEEWMRLGESATEVGRYDLARSAYREAAARPGEVSFGLGEVMEEIHRVDPAAALELADRLIAGDTASPGDLYQAHRVLLAGGRVRQAAVVAERYLASSSSASGRLVRIRQLCGEGRTADATAFYESLGASPAGDPAMDLTFHWHMLNYLGRMAEAAEVLRPLDEAGELYTLSTFLIYTFFDPRPYPNLSAALRRNASLRAEPLPIPYKCPALP